MARLWRLRAAGRVTGCWAAICLAACGAAAQPPAPTPDKPQVIRSEHLAVYYERWTERPSARDASRIGEARLPEIARDLGYTPDRPIVIAVYRDRRDFLDQAGVSGSGPIGVVRYPGNIIYLDVSGTRLRLARVVPHEMTHVIVMRVLGPEHMGKLPRWFNEGLAEHESRVWSSMEEAALGRLLRSKQTVPLGRLSEAFQGPDDTIGDAYLQAWSVVRFLADRQGDDIGRRILTALKRQPDFESALAAETGLDLAGVDRAWHASARAAVREPHTALAWGLVAAKVLGAAAAVALFARIWLALRRRAADEDDITVSEERQE